MKRSNPGLQRSRATRRISGRAQQDHILDPYQREQKLHDGTVCPQCGVVYHEGRWRWVPRAEGAVEALCAACRRINDKYPAGIVTLKGPVVRQHEEEIINLARNLEQAEKQDHPLNRIIAIDKEEPDTLVITTTDVHLPRRIGTAIHHAFQGDLKLHFDEDNYFIRVDWARET